METKMRKHGLTTLEVIREIKKAIDKKKPLSVVRVGDGENICLAQYKVWPIRKTLATRWARLSRTTNWKGVRLPNVRLRDQLVEAIQKADIVGIPYYNDKEILAKQKYLRTLTDACFDKLAIQPKQICHTFVNRHLVENRPFWKMLEGKKVVLISRWSYPFKKFIKKQYNEFDIKIVKAIQINRYQEIPKVIRKMKSIDCDIVFISAGVNAVILAQKLAEKQGRIAIDFGKSAVFMLKGSRKVKPWHPKKANSQKNLKERRVEPLKVTVMGSGYVGTTTALVLSDLGHEVIGYDVDKDKIDNLNNGILPFSEPGLGELLRKQLNNKKIVFTTDSRTAILGSEILIISVGTPSASSGRADLTYIQQVIDVIALYINEPKIIVTKSTVPIGTNRWIKEQLESKINSKQYPVDVVSNPEFLREGAALHDSFHPSRTVIGGEGAAVEKIKEMYAGLPTKFFTCNFETAEMIKYASNGFLAAKISYINEIARLADLVGANIQEVAKGMGMDPRISSHHLYAGIGYGGSCFPKDVDELLYTARQHKVKLKLLKQVKRVNDSQLSWFMKKIESKLSLKGKRLLVLGVTFKEDTDDQRKSPGIHLVQKLLDMGAQEVRIIDPTVASLKDIHWSKSIDENSIQRVAVITDPEKAALGVHAVLLATPWPEFSSYPWQAWAGITESAYLFDGRNFLDPQQMLSYGWYYSGIARGGEVT